MRTLKSRLTWGLGFMFAIILLMSGLGAYFLRDLSRSTTLTLRDNYRSVDYARAMTEALADLREIQLTTGPADPAYAQARVRFERYAQAERNNITEPGEQALADSLSASFARYAAVPVAQSGAIYPALRGQIGRVATLNLHAIEQQSEQVRRTANRTSTVLGLLAGTGLLLALSFLLNFPDYLARPISELTAGVRRLADGHYDQRLPVRPTDEFAPVAQALNEMARRLEGYEQPADTPYIDSSGPLEVVGRHQRPARGPQAAATTTPVATTTPAGNPAQRGLVEQLRRQARELQRTADALLKAPVA